MTDLTRIANDDLSVLELVAELSEEGLEHHLGDGNTSRTTRGAASS